MTSVLVVDDSRFMRTVIGDVLADEGYEVYRAASGEQAIEAVETHDPDIVTMDVAMPGMSGLEAVERIMAEHPTPIVMLSAHTDTGADETLAALSRGAVDFLHKPDGEVTTDIEGLEDRLLRKVRTAQHVELGSVAGERSQRVAPAGPGGGTEAETAEPSAAAERAERVPAPEQWTEHPTVVIGASTGGPKVVERVLAGLPTTTPARILVVQHMPEDFTGRLAARLDAFLPFDVSEAEDRDLLGDGDVVVAPGDRHLEVVHYAGGHLRVELSDDEPIHGVRPAIDRTMETAAEHVDDRLVGVALTGMGKDGAAGIEAISEAGGYTIAQDRETSPVYGIPRQAVETGSVDATRADDEIAGEIVAACAADGDTHG